MASRFPRIIFITATDTNVGKTLLTASLLFHLRSRGIHALAMKPFCSGSREDVALLQAIQPDELGNAEANPFYFREPLAPLVAARLAKRTIKLQHVIQSIRRIAAKCDLLLVEGAGGLLAPLGPGFSALDLITALRCEVCVVAANKLGTLNHTLLTLRAIPENIRRKTRAVLMQTIRSPDPSARTNPILLRELLAPVPLFTIPYLGPRASTLNSIRKHSHSLQKILAAIMQTA